jgi:glycogen synthase
LLMGRDDPRQKGFDVVAEAIRHIPTGRARYIFTPMPGAEGFEGLAFLEKLAEERPGEVKAFPFRLDPEPFAALKEGSSFMVMGSLYEPFGAANEAYLAGMPVVARATGGLVQQVVPCPSASLSRQGRQLVALFHGRKSEATGLLYREPSVPDVVQGWKKIVDCDYWDQEPRGDRIEDRRGTPLFDAMVTSAAWALQDAIDLYTLDQAGYARMIYHGYKMLDNFRWDRAVQGYRRLYDRVCK